MDILVSKIRKMQPFLLPRNGRAARGRGTAHTVHDIRLLIGHRLLCWSQPILSLVQLVLSSDSVWVTGAL